MAYKLNGTELTPNGRCYFNGTEVRKIIYNGTKVWERCYALIPVMTSASAPSGTVVQSSRYNSNYEGYNAFDGDLSTAWLSQADGTASTVTSEYLGYLFPETVYLDHLKYVGYETNPNYGSAYDTTIYVEIFTSSGLQTLEVSWSTADMYNEITIPCGVSDVQQVRISFSNRMRSGANDGSRHYVCCAELQAYGYVE